MRTLTSAQVRTNFGAAANVAKNGEAVAITQYGRPALMPLSYQEGEELLRLRAAATMNRCLEGRARTIPQGEAVLSLGDVNSLVHVLRT